MITISEYLTGAKPEEIAEFERVRSIIYNIAPDAVESISYAMPTFKYKDKPLLYFGVFKDHMSIFPTGAPTEALADLLQDFKVSKGTIQFTVDKPLPESTIAAIVTFRLQEINSKK